MQTVATEGWFMYHAHQNKKNGKPIYSIIQEHSRGGTMVDLNAGGSSCSTQQEFIDLAESLHAQGVFSQECCEKFVQWAKREIP